MILVKPSATIVSHTPNPLLLIERAGRVCYKSESDGDPEKFVRSIIKRGHESVIEHASATVHFVVDRGVSHELVRHRLASFSQESTRYVNYAKSGECTFVIPWWLDIAPGEYARKMKDECWYFHKDGVYENIGCSVAGYRWLIAMSDAECEYIHMVGGLRMSPQQARAVLPNSTKTEVYVTANFREWRHVFKLRTSKAAHPDMVAVLEPLRLEFKTRWPWLFPEDENGKQ